MKQTKEQIAKELTELRTKYDILKSNEERTRKEFSKIFEWREYRPYVEIKNIDFRNPSWEEIFTEVGKLLENRETRSKEEYLKELESKLNYTNEKVKSIKDKYKEDLIFN